MNVFLSWSGEPSLLVAEALHEWLPRVIQSLKPWMSSRDIAKGARWSDEIKAHLNACTAGIVCVTPGNMEQPWLLFEAGALAKTVERPMVCTYLLGLSQAELRPPLAEFQATLATRDETKRLLETLNKALGHGALGEKQLSDTFEKFWPDLDDKLTAIHLGITDAAPKRSMEDLLEEVLGLVREAGRNQMPSEMIKALVEHGMESLLRSQRLMQAELLRFKDPYFGDFGTVGDVVSQSGPDPSRVQRFEAAALRLSGKPAHSASASPSAAPDSPPVGNGKEEGEG